MNIRKAFLHKAVPAACVLFAAGTIFAADRADLMGYVPGAEVMKVDVTDGRIDTISGIIYSQIKSQRSIRQLRMTVMTPRTKARKPAVVYFPGGGFTSADHEKFIEMALRGFEWVSAWLSGIMPSGAPPPTPWRSPPRGSGKGGR